MAETTTHELIEAAARAAAIVVCDVLERRSVEDNDLALARIAATAVSNYAKMYQATSAREATMATLITHSAEGTEDFRRLAMAALPGSPVAKALAKHSEAERSQAEPSRAKPSEA